MHQSAKRTLWTYSSPVRSGHNPHQLEETITMFENFQIVMGHHVERATGDEHFFTAVLPNLAPPWPLAELQPESGLILGFFVTFKHL